ncbi:MAG: replication-associated recombination protein A [Clostridia bacterium]|nr:replication-associated recombination protein A [Clostridia bacterium]
MTSPLADRLRPVIPQDVVGQQHLLGEGKMLSKIISSKYIPNMIFYGPSGVGKTTVANIIANISDKKLYKLNATNCSVSDVKAIINDTECIDASNGILLYLDEIQNFNKKQQQSLLEVVENGRITLIASTTENPYFYVYNALLSRCTVFEFKPVDEDSIINALKRGVSILEKDYNKSIKVDNDAFLHLSATANGDVRKAINGLELAVLSNAVTDQNEIVVDLKTALEASQKSGFKFDKDGDSHYDILSAFQKSIRGSDPDAAIHYLARLVVGGDLASICRRLMVIASEDIGLAYPTAASIVKSCCDSALQLGFPEARIPLAQAVLLLATAPKSNSVVNAIDSAISDINSIDIGDIPAHLKDGHYEGAKKLGRAESYKYPHAYPNNYVKQQYLPDNLISKTYYKPGNNKNEQSANQFWKKIK